MSETLFGSIISIFTLQVSHFSSWEKHSSTTFIQSTTCYKKRSSLIPTSISAALQLLKAIIVIAWAMRKKKNAKRAAIRKWNYRPYIRSAIAMTLAITIMAIIIHHAKCVFSIISPSIDDKIPWTMFFFYSFHVPVV